MLQPADVKHIENYEPDGLRSIFYAYSLKIK